MRRRHCCMCGLLLACAALGALASPMAAQGTVGEALLMNVVNHAGTLLSAGHNVAASTIMQPAMSRSQLPRCRRTHVLRAAGGFPHDWSRLSAEEQAMHPINLPMMQLAYSVYQPVQTFATCLKNMGIDSILPVNVHVPGYFSSATAHVMKAGNESLFVVFKGSEASNWLQDLECGHSDSVGSMFGASSADVRLHTGFLAGWQALEAQLVAAVLEFLQEVPSGRVYVAGHSLGGALASIAALRLSRILPAPAHVAGVWLLASPRTGNPVWRTFYNAVLLHKTLRITNYLDVAARAPKPLEACAATGASVMNLLAPTQHVQYAHVGRSLLMCPTRSGFTQFAVWPRGSEVTDCPGAALDADATFATHLLGSYFDAWRRGYAATTGDDLSGHAAVGAVMCDECTVQRPTPLAQIAVPARAGGPVTCGVAASCQNSVAWDVVTTVGEHTSMRPLRTPLACAGFMCS